MGKRVTFEQYANMLSERTYDNTQQLKRGVKQRRNGMEDLYGICFSANGDADNPAKFYISLSPDYIYLHRFAFKLVVKPYASAVLGASSSGGGGSSVSLTKVADYISSGTSTLYENGVTPNPHSHDSSSVETDLEWGVKKISTESSTWAISIAGVDISAYLKEQHDGDWITGEGVYPNNSLADEIENFYDILDVVSVMTAEGNTDDAQKIIKPTFKAIEISSDEKFGVDLYLYLKYSTVNR